MSTPHPFGFDFRPASYRKAPLVKDHWEGEPNRPAWAPKKGERCLATIYLDSHFGDEIYIYVRRVGERYHYRCVDCYEGSDWTLPRKTSVKTLTLGQMIEMVDGAEGGTGGWGSDTPFLQEWWEQNLNDDPWKAAFFAKIWSPVYTQLEAFYEARAEAWVQEVLMRESFDWVRRWYGGKYEQDALNPSSPDYPEALASAWESFRKRHPEEAERLRDNLRRQDEEDAPGGDARNDDPKILGTRGQEVTYELEEFETGSPVPAVTAARYHFEDISRAYHFYRHADFWTPLLDEGWDGYTYRFGDRDVLVFGSENSPPAWDRMLQEWISWYGGYLLG